MIEALYNLSMLADYVDVIMYSYCVAMHCSIEYDLASYVTYFMWLLWQVDTPDLLQHKIKNSIITIIQIFMPRVHICTH